MNILSIILLIISVLCVAAIAYLYVLFKRVKNGFSYSLEFHSMEIRNIQDGFGEIETKYLALKESTEKSQADLMLAYHELEKRVIALEHFKEDVGTEILETVQEQKKQEQKISEGMDNIFSYTSQGKKDK